MSQSQAKGALTFLQYLHGYLGNEEYWLSWSLAGVHVASQLLEVPVSRVARTNNHLESFNGRIKGRYYKPYQHSGHLPQIDVWILLIVTAVMPDFFKECREKQALKDHYAVLQHVAMTTGLASLLSQLEVPSSAHDKSTANLTEANSDDEAIQMWLTDLLCADNDDENHCSDGDSCDSNATSQVGPELVGHAGVDHVEKDQDTNLSGFPRCGLRVPEVMDNADLPNNMDCCLDGPENDLDLYVSTSMDFEEECIIGANYKQVIIFAIKPLGHLLVSFENLAGVSQTSQIHQLCQIHVDLLILILVTCPIRQEF